MKLISEICGRYYGKPILVIGGGPSASADLLKIPADYPGCVISANQHGFQQDRFKVDYIVSVDFLFSSTSTPMRDYLAQFNTPSINRWSWADYRIPEFDFNGDSGMTAVVVAAMLGGWPIIPVGMDRFVGAKRYFWQGSAEKGWDKRRAPDHENVRVNVARCVQMVSDRWVLCHSGPMREYWSPVRIRENGAHVDPAFTPPNYKQCGLVGRLYGIDRPIFLHPTDRVSHGPVLLTDNEARGFVNTKRAFPL